MILPLILLETIKKEGAIWWVEKNSQKVDDMLVFKDDKFRHAIECHDNKRSDCIFGNNQAEVSLILVGDSHSASLLPVLDKMAKEQNTAIATFMASSCPVAFKIQVRKGDSGEKNGLFCLETLEKFKQALQQYPNARVLISNRNNAYLIGANENKDRLSRLYFYKEYVNTTNSLSIKNWQQDLSNDLFESTCEIAKTHKVYWFKPTPEIGIDVPKILAQNIFYRNDNRDIKISIDEYQKRQYLIDPIQQRAKQECGVNIVDINPAFCDKEYCYGSSGRKVYYADDDHLSITGSELARPYLEFLFEKK